MVSGSLSDSDSDLYKLARGTNIYVINGLLPQDKANGYIIDCKAEFNSAHTTEAAAITMSNIVLADNSGNIQYNYIFDDTYSVNLTGYIERRPISLTWADLEFTYDGAEHCPTATLPSDVVESDKDNLKITVTGAQKNASDAWSAVAHLTSTSADTRVDDYSLSNGTKVYKIKKAPITIAMKDLTVTYDGKEHTLSEGEVISETTLISGHTFTCIGAENKKDVGVYNIEPKDVKIVDANTADMTGNYDITLSNQGKLTINTATVTVSGIKAKDKDYDGNTTAELDLSDITFTGIKDGDQLSLDSSKVTGAFVNAAAGDNKTVNITIDADALTGTSKDNYTLVVADSQKTTTADIKKVKLDVTIDNKEIIYGSDVSFTFNYSGFVNNENENVVRGTPAFKVGSSPTAADAYAKTLAVGSYNIYLSALTADNYEFNIQNGTLTINQRPITINAVSGIDKISKEYDGNTKVTKPLVKGTHYTIDGDGTTESGIANNDDLTLTYTAAYALKDAGDRTITVNGFSVNNNNATNYEIKNSSIELPGEITKKKLTVTAEDKNITYGDNAPTYTEKYEGFITGESKTNLGGTLAFACDYDTSVPTKRNATDYEITPSGLTSDNYDIEFKKGKLTVKKETLNVNTKASTDNVTYGHHPIPDFSYEFAGFKYDDDANDVTVSSEEYDKGNLTDAAVTEDGVEKHYVNSIPGTYTVKIKTEGKFSADNYTFNPVGTTITVNRASLTISGITVNSRVYDGTTTVNQDQFNYNNVLAQGLLSFDEAKWNSEKQALFTIKNATYNSKNVSEANTATFTIVYGDYLKARYDANNDQTTAAALITQRPVTITADDKTVFYGHDAPTYTVKYDNLVEGETATIDNVTVTSSYTTTKAVGEYTGDIVVSDFKSTTGFDHTNYTPTYVPGKLTVSQYKLNTPEPKWSTTDIGTVTWAAIPGMSEVEVASYNVELYKDNAKVGNMITVDENTLKYDFLETMRTNGAGEYTVKVQAVPSLTNNADKKNVGNSDFGTSDKWYAAEVEFVAYTGDNGISSKAFESGTVKNEATYVVIAGEKDIPIKATLVNKTGYTYESITSIDKITVSGNEDKILSDGYYAAKISLASTYKSKNKITVRIKLAARPATLDVVVKAIANGKGDVTNEATYGYPDNERPKLQADVSHTDGEGAPEGGYTYTYSWELKNAFTTDKNLSSTNTLTFPSGKNAFKYYVRCVVTAKRNDNDQTITVDESFKNFSDKWQEDNSVYQVEIKRAEFTAEVAMANWTYGEEQKNPELTTSVTDTENPAIKNNKFYYCLESEASDEEKWTTTKPSDAGNYLIRAEIPSGENYEAFKTSNVAFEIKQAKLSTPTNLSIAPSSTASYGVISWDKVTPPKKNNVTDTITVKYEVKLYKDDVLVKTYDKTAATSMNITEDMQDSAVYKFTVQAMSSDTKNCLDSDVATSDTIPVNATISASGTGELSGSTFTQKYDATAVTLTAGISSGTVTSYQWYKNGVAISGATSQTYLPKHVADSGKYTCVLVVDGKNVYTPIMEVVITKRDLQITSNNAEKVYDGTELTNHNVTVNEDGFADGEGADYSFTGTATNVADTKDNNNTFTWSFNDKTTANDYNVLADAYGKLTITPRPLTTTDFTIANVDAVTYKAAAYTPKPTVTDKGLATNVDTALVNNTDITYTYTDNVNAGTATITITGKGNYKDTLTKKFTIKQRPVTINGKSEEKTYSGSEQTINTVEQTGLVSGHKHNVTFEAKGTEVNTYTGTITAKNDVVIKDGSDNVVTDNYVITVNNGSLTIKKTDAEWSISLENDTYTYDATEHYNTKTPASTALTGTTTYQYSFKENEDYVNNLSDLKMKDAGTYTIYVKATNPNYSKEVTTTAKLIINKRDLEITTDGATKEYDGNALTASGYTVTGIQGNETYGFVTTGTITDFGKTNNTYTMTFAASDNTYTAKADNYNIKTVTLGELEITKRVITVKITGNNRTETYDSNKHEASGYTWKAYKGGSEDDVNLYKADFMSFSGDAYANRTNSGTTNMGLTTAMFTNNSDNYDVTFEVVDGYVKINKKSGITVYITGEQNSHVYDGQDHTVSTYTHTAKDGEENYELYTSDCFKIKNTVSVKRKDAGTTNMGLTADMFENTSDNFENVTFNIALDGYQKITPITDKVTVTIKGKTGSTVYDGDDHVIEGYDFEPSNTLFVKEFMTFSGTASATQKNYGTAYMGLAESQFTKNTANFTNVEFKVTDGYSDITKRPVKITVSDNTKVYGKPDPTFAGTVNNLAKNETLQNLEYYRTNPTAQDVNKYEGVITARFTDDPNYSVTVTPADFTITKSSDWELTVTNYTGNYDNASHNTVASANVTTGTTIKYSTDGGTKWSTTVPEIKDVGTKTVKVKAENSNYNDKEATYTLKVNPKLIDITVDNETKVYGENDPTFTVHKTGLYGTDDVTVNVARDTGENVGDYTIRTSGTELQGNYKLVFHTGTLTINQRSVTESAIDVAAISNVIYKGSEHKPEPDVTDSGLAIKNNADTVLVKGTDFTYSYENNINVGTATVKITGKGNYKDEITRTFEIEKKPVNFKGKNESLEYTGEPRTINTVEYLNDTSLVAGHTSNVQFSATGTEAGPHDGTITAASDVKIMAGEVDVTANYDITTENGTLTITPTDKTFTIALVGSTYTYDGGDHWIENTPTSKAKTGTTTFTYSFNQNGTYVSDLTSLKKKDAGTYTVYVKGDNPNYQATATTTASLVINPKGLTVVTEGTTDVYDGEPLTNKNGSVTGFVEGETYKFETTGTITNVGKTNNTYKLTFNEDDSQYTAKKNNYKIDSETLGKLEVTTCDVTVTVKGKTDSKDYDGQSHTMTGYDLKKDKDLYDLSKVTYSGTATATTTDVAKVMMNIDKEKFANTDTNFNVTFDVTDGYMEVTEKTVTLDWDVVDYTYDGTSKSITASVSNVETRNGVKDDVVVATYSDNAKVNAGNYTAKALTLSGKDAGNYKIVGGTNGWEIKKRTIVFSGTTQHLEYTGSDQTITDISITGLVSGHTHNVAFSATGKEASTYDGTITAANAVVIKDGSDNVVTSNYTITTTAGQLIIDPTDDAWTIALEGSTPTYDGKDHWIENKPTTDANTGTTTYTYSFEENGTYVSDLASLKKKDAGTYTVYVKATNPNYSTTATTTAELKIEQAPLTIETKGTKDVYDGEPLTNENGTVTGIVEGETYGFETTGTITNVGETDNTYKLTFAKEGNTYTAKEGNYKITSTTLGKLEVTQCAVTVTVKGKTDSKVYDGQSHTMTGYDLKKDKDLYDLDKVTYSGTATATTKDVAKVMMNIDKTKFANTDTNFNVTFDVTDGYMEVTQKTGVVVKITGNHDSKEYDSQKHDISGYAWEFENDDDLYDDNYFSFTGTAKAERTEEGTTMMGLTPAMFANTNTNFKDVTFEVTDGYQKITPVTDQVTVTITGKNRTETYSGTKYEVSGYEFKSDNALYLESYVTFSGNKDIDRTVAGTTEMKLADDQFANNSKNFTNVEFVVTDGFVKIDPRPVTITVNNSTKVYGNDDPDFTGDVNNLVKNEELKNLKYVRTNTDEKVGEYTDVLSATFDDDPNYDVKITKGKFEITKSKKLTVTGTDYDGFYDGGTHGDAAVVNITEGTKIEYSIDGGTTWKETVPTIKDYGTVNVKVRATNHDYEDATDDYTLNVKREVVTVKAKDADKVYGEDDPTLEVDKTGLIGNDDVTVTVSRAPGETVSTYDITASGTQYQGNYELKFEKGEFSITQKPVTLTWDVVDYTYDGTSKSITASVSNKVTRNGIEDVVNVATYSENDKVNADDYTAVALTLSGKDAGNYKIVDGTHAWKIKKKEVTFNGKSDTLEYSGSEQTISTVEVTGLVSGHTHNVVFEAKGTEADTYTGTITAENAVVIKDASDNNVTNNYDITVNNGTLTIDPTDDAWTIALEGSTPTYDGKDHWIENKPTTNAKTGTTTFTYSFDKNGTYVSDLTSLKKKDAGTYTVYVKGDNPNYSTTAETAAELKIEKAKLTITTGSADKKYDTSALTCETVSVNGIVEGETYGLVTTGTITNVGSTDNTYDLTFAGILNAYTAKKDNYQIQNENLGTLRIDRRDVTVNVTGHRETAVYDKKLHKVTGYDLSTEDQYYQVSDVRFNGTDEVSRTDYGKDMMKLVKSQFSNVNNNYNVEFVIDDGYVDITQKTGVVVKITGNHDSKEYDSQKHDISGYAWEFENDDDLYDDNYFSFTGTAKAERTEEGTTMMGLTPAMFANTNTNFKDVTFEVTDGYQKITPVTDKVTVTITGKNRTETYSGTKYEVSGYEFKSDNALYLESYVTFSGNKDIDRTVAGTTEMKLADDQFANNSKNFTNVEFVVTDGFVKIDPRPVTITVNNSTKVYGNDDPDFTGDVNNLVKNEELKNLKYVRTNTDEKVGEYTDVLSATFDADPNYDVTITKGKFEITPSDVLKVSVTDYTGDYDGKTHSTTATVNITDGTKIEYSIDGGKTWDETVPTIRDVDTINVMVRATNHDYKDSTDSYTLKVEPAVVTVKVKDATKVYGDDEPTAFEVEKTGLIGNDDVKVTVSRDAGETSGTYDIIATGDQYQGNYELKFEKGTFSISQKTVTLDWDVVDYTYDGTSKAITASVSNKVTRNGIEDDVVVATYNENQAVNADDYTAVALTLSGKDAGNYKIVDGTHAWKIKKKEVTFNGKSETLEYNGSEQTISTVEVTGLVNGHTHNVVFEAKGTEADTYDGTITAENAVVIKDGSDTNVTNNYDITVNNGTLTIDPTDDAWTIALEGSTPTYDGKDHWIENKPTTDAKTGTTTYTYSFDKNGTYVSDLTSLKKKDAGTYTVYVKGDNPNYSTTATTTAELKIEKAKLTITTGSADKKYDSDPLTCETVSVNGIVEGETYGLVTTGTITDVGSTDNTYEMTFAGKDNDYTAKADNYVIDSVTLGKLRIDQREITVNIKGDQDSVMYDGNNHVVDGYTWTAVNDLGLYKQAYISFTGNDHAEEKTQGKKFMGLTVGQFTNTNNNFKVTFNVEDGYIEVTKKTGVVVKITGNHDSKVYNGKKHNVSGYTWKAENDDDLYDVNSFRFTGIAEAERIDEGKTMMGLTPSMFTNTNDNFDKVTFIIDEDGYQKITPVTDQVTVTITGRTRKETYDGTEYGITGYDFASDNTLYLENYVRFSGNDDIKRTKAGTTKMNLAPEQFTNISDNFTNVEFVVTDGSVTIDKRPVTITVNNSTKVYGNDDPDFTGNVNNLVKNEELKNLKYVRTNTDEKVGEYTDVLSATFDDDPNYDVTITKGKFEITPSDVLKVSVTDYTGDYDGKTHSTTATVNITEGTKIEYSIDGGKTWDETVPTIKDVDTINVKVRATNHDYKESTDSYTLKVEPAVVTVKVKDATKVYGDDEPTAFEVEKTGLIGSDDVTVNVSRKQGETSGTYDIIATGDQYQGNYELKFEKGTFSISQKTVTLDWDVVDYTYDGTSKAITASVSNKVTRNGIEDVVYVATYNENDEVNAGDYTAVALTLGGKDAANYKIVDGTNPWKIKKKEVSFIGKADSLEYTGGEQKITTVEENGLVKGHTHNVEFEATGRDVGTYDGKITAANAVVIKDALNNDVTANYSITTDAGKLTIDPSDDVWTVSLEGSTYTYDGKNHHIDQTAVTDAKTGTTTYTYSFDKNGTYVKDLTTLTKKDAGTYTVYVKAVNPNYSTTAVTTSTLTINKRDLTITTGGDEKDYDGTALTSDEVKIEGMVDGETYGLVTTGTITDHGTADNTYKLTFAGLFNSYTAKENNYNVKTVTLGKLTVNQRKISVNITGNSDNSVYDGKTHSISGYTWKAAGDNGLYEEKFFSFTGSAKAERKDSGKAEMGLTSDQFTNKNDNFDVTFNVTDGYVEVTKKSGIIVKITGNHDSTVYDGKLHSISGYTWKSENDNGLYDENSFTFNGTAKAERVESGKTLMNLTADMFVNKDDNFDKVTFVIDTDGYQEVTPITDQVTVTITGQTCTETYDGIEYSVEGYDFATDNDLYLSAYMTFTGNASAKRKDAGTTNMNLAPAQFANRNTNFTNVEFKVNDGYVTIDKRPVDITVNNSIKVFDNADPVFTGTVSNLVNGETLKNLKYIRTNNDETVGKYTGVLTATFDDDPNYTISVKNGNFEIVKSGVLMISYTDYTGVYDGETHQPAVSVTIPEGTVISYSTDEGKTWDETAPSIRDIGEVHVMVKAHNPNYEEVTGSYVLKVTPALVRVIAKDDTKVYGNGDMDTFEVVKTGLFGNDDVKYTVTREGGETVGTYLIRVSGEEYQGNYRVEYVSGKYTIARRTVDLIWDKEEFLYDGTKKRVTATVVDALATASQTEHTVETDDVFVTKYINNEAVDAGEYIAEAMLLSGKDANNYVLINTTHEWRILKADQVIIPGVNTFVYDGKPHTHNATLETGNGVCVSENATHTDAGTYPVKFSVNETANYRSAALDSTMYITPKLIDATIDISEPANGTYNGKPNTPTIVVKDMAIDGGRVLKEGKDYTLTYENNVNAGKAKVKITFIGNYTGNEERTFTINPAKITLRPNDASSVAKQPLAKLSYRITGGTIYNNDDIGNYVITTDADKKTAGTYDITMKLNGTANPNYEVTIAKGVYKVTAAPASSGKDHSKKPTVPTLTDQSDPTVYTPADPTDPHISSEDATDATTLPTVIEEEDDPNDPHKIDETDPSDPGRNDVIEPGDPGKNEQVDPSSKPGTTEGSEKTEQLDVGPIPEDTWSIFNLVLTILTGLLAIFLLLTKDKKEDEDTMKRYKRRKAPRILSILICAVTLIMFVLTEDIRKHLVLFDEYTIYFTLLCVLQFGIYVVGQEWKEDAEEVK